MVQTNRKWKYICCMMAGLIAGAWCEGDSMHVEIEIHESQGTPSAPSARGEGGMVQGHDVGMGVLVDTRNYRNG